MTEVSQVNEYSLVALTFPKTLTSKNLTDQFSAISVPMTQDMITITVKLFAAYQEAVGQSELQLSVPANTSVVAIRDRLVQQHPQLSQWQDLTRYGVNLNFVAPETILQDGDEVVLIPPVSGG